MKYFKKTLSFTIGVMCSHLIVSQAQSFEQPSPKDLELAERQLIEAAECKIKIDPKDESINYLVAVNGGRLEHYSAKDKPFTVLGLESRKIDTYYDPTGNTPDIYATLINASMNTVKQKSNLEKPVKTEVGTLSVRYGSVPGVVEIVCTIDK